MMNGYKKIINWKTERVAVLLFLFYCIKRRFFHRTWTPARVHLEIERASLHKILLVGTFPSTTKNLYINGDVLTYEPIFHSDSEFQYPFQIFFHFAFNNFLLFIQCNFVYSFAIVCIGHPKTDFSSSPPKDLRSVVCRVKPRLLES